MKERKLPPIVGYASRLGEINFAIDNCNRLLDEAVTKQQQYEAISALDYWRGQKMLLQSSLR